METGAGGFDSGHCSDQFKARSNAGQESSPSCCCMFIACRHDTRDKLRRRSMSFNPFRRRQTDPERMPPRVTLVQWTLASVPVVLSAITTEVNSYKTLAIITQICAAVSVVLLISVTREAIRARVVGKCCLIAGVFVFYWIDAVALTLQPTAFAIPDGFPINATLFSQDLIRQALIYVALFQLMVLIGYSIRPRFDKPLTFLASRIDSLSFDRSILGLMLILCAVLPLVTYY